MSKKQIKIAITFFSFLFFSLLIPQQSTAFLAVGTAVLVGKALLPLFGGLVVGFVVNVFLFFKKVPKKIWLAATLGLVVALSVLGLQGYQRFRVLYTSNRLGAELDVEGLDAWQSLIEQAAISSSLEGQQDAQSQARWQVLLDKVDKSGQDGITSDLIQEDDQFCHKRGNNHISQLDKDVGALINSRDYKTLDVSCAEVTVKNGKKACGLAWEIFTDFDDEERVHELMSAQGVQPGDNVLLFCEYGVTTSHLSFILEHYGYNVNYGGLVDVETDLLDIPFNSSLDAFVVLIDVFKFRPNEQYLYFLINERDKDLFYAPTSDNLKDNLPNFTLINTTDLPLEYENDLPLKPHTQNESSLEKINISDYKIVCKNKLHCFLTRHYLAFKNIKDFDTLYCQNCATERTANYCEE